MLRFIEQSGPFILLQFVLALLILTLTAINVFRLALGGGRRAAAARTSIDAILFWGCLTAVFGFLGQWSGLYRASKAVMAQGAINPPAFVLGVGESLGTSVFGLFALLVAAFLWFGLRVAQRLRVV